MKQLNIKDTLFEYVTDQNKWFYWYHSPERLEELYKQDHEEDPDYKADSKFNFIKRRWRFNGKTVTRNDGKQSRIEENLADFFDAVLDEVRLKKANDFAEYALYISDNEDLAYFRNTVAKREVIADIDYNRQRDHAVHTLYNYLLGWYIFDHSVKLSDAFKDHFVKKLKIYPDKCEKQLLKFYNKKQFHIKVPTASNISIGLVHEFADVWLIASLLHDIGYILEGSLSSASPDVEHLRVSNGSKIIHDYFNHYFWKSFEVDFRVGKNIAKTLDVVVPDFRYSVSLASLGDRLCDIGSCENIRKELDKAMAITKDKAITEQYGLNREAFSIWKEHYKLHNIDKMEIILSVIERVYKNMLWVGSDYGKRNLDHGVCSGLITLQALTFFRELFWGFCQTDWVSSLGEDEEPSFCLKQKKSRNTVDRVSQELFEHIKKEITRVPKRIRVIRDAIDPNGDCNLNKDNIFCKLRPDFWFKKILWATASSAIHSIIQKKEYTKQCLKHLDKELKQSQDSTYIEEDKNVLDNKLDNLKISVDDDPLAFLGVFVDILQEWDRYKVTGRGEAAFSGDEPLQSTGVYLFKNKGDFDKSGLEVLYEKNCEYNVNSIYLMYPAGDHEKKDWVTELKKTMRYGLKSDWNSIVEIVTYREIDGQ